MTPRENLPIGIFDSGLGGLTVAKAVHRLLPNEHLLYVGDTARVPYGTKSPEMIKKYAFQISFFLLQKKVKALVVACNSVSAVALKALQDLPIPVVGVIDPGARAAALSTSNMRVGIIGTNATIRSHSYTSAIRHYSSRVRVVEQACPLFVPLVEEGWTNSPITLGVAQEYLRPFRKTKIDTLILGCTHYPLLKHLIQSVMGRGVHLIDSAEETAKDVAATLKKTKLLNSSTQPGRLTFFVTDNPASFVRNGQKFFGPSLPAAKLLRFDSV